MFLVSMAIIAMSVNVAHAKNIQKQNIVELITHTDSILVGTVSSKKDGFHQGLPYTEITLEVGQSLKGQHGPTYTFRQFGLISLLASLGFAASMVIISLVFNLVSDIIGGVWISVIEEETARPIVDVVSEDQASASAGADRSQSRG